MAVPLPRVMVYVDPILVGPPEPKVPTPIISPVGAHMPATPLSLKSPAPPSAEIQFPEESIVA